MRRLHPQLFSFETLLKSVDVMIPVASSLADEQWLATLNAHDQVQARIILNLNTYLLLSKSFMNKEYTEMQYKSSSSKALAEPPQVL
jgi:hypothetical protein